MGFDLIAFYAFAAVTILAALAVITVKNPVHAALFLVLTFFTCACVWMTAHAEFLGITLVLVYVGAVMVLFLFVVMMLDINLTPLREGFQRYLPIGILVAIIMAVEIFVLMGWKKFTNITASVDPALAMNQSNIEWIGTKLFTEYLLPFETAAVILLLATVAAIALTLRRRENTKHQDPSRQVMVKRDDRVRLVKVESEKNAESEKLGAKS